MKKTLLVLMAVVLSLGTLFLTSCGADDVSPENATEGLVYILDDLSDKDEYILAGIGNAVDKDIVIANEYNGSPVTSIAPDAFSGCTEITSVKIPLNVKKIGAGAFAGCTSLKTVSFAVSDKCKVDAIGAGAFYNCTSLESIVIPKSVKAIEPLTFYNCKSLEDVDMELPVNMETVGDKAFFGCESLTTISFPNKRLKMFGASVLEGCSNLFRLEVPFVGMDKEGASNAHLGYFFGSASNSGVPASLKKVSVTKAQNIGANAFAGCVNISEIELDDDILAIGHSAFKGCTGLTEMTLPLNVANVGAKAFEGCSSLRSLTLPFVGASAEEARNYYLGYIFGASSYLENGEYVPASLEEIIVTAAKTLKTNTFFDCASLKTVVVHAGVTSIGSGTFAGCDSIEKMVLPFVGASKDEKANTFFGYIFGARGYGENGIIPATLKTVEITDADAIAANAFQGCASIESIKLARNIATVGKNAFLGTAFYENEENWENGVLYINEMLITVKDDFAGVCTVKEGTVYIAEAAFENCMALTGVVLDKSVSYIDVAAFKGCENLAFATFNNTESGWKAGNAEIADVTNSEENAKFLRETYIGTYIHFTGTVSAE